jgi:HSP20 family molecular chaperone IbpA
MRTYDFSPFTRLTIGFESLFDRLNSLQRPENGDSYPPTTSFRTETMRSAFRLRSPASP